jgi:octaprenyl-diphosphate synthase
LIHALDQAPRSEKQRIINLIKNHNTDTAKVAEVIDFVRKSGGLDYARKAMLEYREKAFILLHEFPESESRASLELLVHYVTDREK